MGKLFYNITTEYAKSDVVRFIPPTFKPVLQVAEFCFE